MKSYDNFLRMTSENLSQMTFVIGLGLIIIGGLILLGGWLPLLCLNGQHAGTTPGRKKQQRQEPLDLTMLLPLQLGGGMVLIVAFGTCSAYISKSLIPGAAAAAILGTVSTVQLIRRLRGRSIGLSVSKRVIVAVTLTALSITMWQHFISELEYDDGYRRSVAFSDLNDDTSFHVYLAIMVRDHGLPLRDLYGSPNNEYCQVTHTGHGVLIGTIASVMSISEFQATAGLWLAASTLLCWSSLAVTCESGLPGFYHIIAALAPLLLGPLMVPSFLPLVQPDAALSIEPVIAGRMYWNVTQALSTAIAGVSLIAFTQYCRTNRDDIVRLRMVATVGCVIVISGWVKPSVFIFYAPALIVTLIVLRSRRTEILMVAIIFACGGLIYLLPVFLVTVPEVPSWSFHPSTEQSIEVARFVGLGCCAALLLAVTPIIRLCRELVGPVQARPVTLPLVAMGGSLLFALIFREDRFVGFFTFQPNIWWGPSACVVLLLPFLIHHAVLSTNSGIVSSISKGAAMALLAIQMLNGMQFAFAAPAINHRAFPKTYTDAMQEARQRTDPLDRILLDPKIGWVDLAGYLRRPALFRTNYMFPEDRQNLDDWNRLFDSPTTTTAHGWRQYDAAIVANDAHGVRNILQDAGWQHQALTDEYSLWQQTTINPSIDGAQHEQSGSELSQ